MGDTHREHWYSALPWIMLGRRVSFQPNLDASAAQMVLNMSPRLPGQLLGHPGPPLSNSQVRALLDQLYRLADRPPVQTSGKREFLDIENETANVTHVYVKVDKPDSLCPKFEGPYKVISRPSRSTVEVKIGMFKSGEPRTLTFHWSLCKPAFMREDATEGSRPMLGRKPKSRTSSSDDDSSSTDVMVEPQLGTPSVSAEFSSTGFSHPNPPTVKSAATDTNKFTREIQTRQTRRTRNPNPNYT